MVNFNENGWFDCDAEKVDYVMKYIDKVTKENEYPISKIGKFINENFELTISELALVYYVLGVYAGENSMKHEKKTASN